jgi:hypothetical protein
MSAPWVPPYFGSYEELVKALLHNPRLGSPAPGPHSTHANTVELNPQPLPPGNSGPVRYLATLVSMRMLARAIPDKTIADHVARGAETGIQEFLDDFCGTPPRKIPWPWPGPPPWVLPLASDLVMFANALQAGEFRDGLMHVAGQIVQKGYSNTAASA